MRLFIAAEPDEAAIDHLKLTQSILGPLIPARWTPPERVHLTLKFLGDTPDSELPRLITSLNNVWIETSPRLKISGAVCFPPHGPIRIVAAAMDDEENRCAGLAGRIDRACHEVGFQLESRRWTAHITLGRVKDRTSPEVRRAIAGAASAGPEFEVDHFSLKENRLDQKGPAYTTIATFH
jgi:2'-5' RNA ligase